MAGRRSALAAGLALFLSGPREASAQGRNGRLWFDPTQLPSYTGVVERYLVNPEGKTDRLLFREGPQVIFPEHVADGIEAASPAGQSIIVYGIRARRAPAITMLAWARDGDAPVQFVDRPAWTFPEYRAAGQRLQVEGTIRAPLFTAQGDTIGAILEDFTVIRVPLGVAIALGDRLNAGRRLAATGQGATVPNKGRSLDADRIGDAPDRLEPLPAPVERP